MFGFVVANANAFGDTPGGDLGDQPSLFSGANDFLRRCDAIVRTVEAQQSLGANGL